MDPFYSPGLDHAAHLGLGHRPAARGRTWPAGSTGTSLGRRSRRAQRDLRALLRPLARGPLRRQVRDHGRRRAARCAYLVETALYYMAIVPLEDPGRRPPPLPALRRGSVAGGGGGDDDARRSTGASRSSPATGAGTASTASRNLGWRLSARHRAPAPGRSPCSAPAFASSCAWKLETLWARLTSWRRRKPAERATERAPDRTPDRAPERAPDREGAAPPVLREEAG